MAGIGPFTSFSFPNVYTRTLTEAPTVTAAGALRFPAFIGVADEVVEVPNFEMVRGSSSIADNPIIREDVSSQLDGTNRNFTVSYYPIVTGDGSGTVTTSPNDVTVFVDGEAVPVSSVNGTTGEIYLVNIPESTSEILISYFYKRTDTVHTDEDQSDQADGSNTAFKVDYVPIVQGDDGGITNTDPGNVIAKVNNVAVTVSEVDGDSGIITLASAPTATDIVTFTYYSNELQDTADVLPSPNVVELTSVGLSPGTSDFINNTDFVLDSTTTPNSNFTTIHWGHSYSIAAGQNTLGYEFFDDTQISGTMFDNRNYRREATGTADGTNATFTMELTPKSGQGLGIDTDDPTKVAAYVGTSPADATAATVISMSSANKTVTLDSAPAADSTVYVTQYTNLLADDTFTLEVTTAGAAGVGQYSMSGSNTGVARQVTWSVNDTTVSGFSTASIKYPNGDGDGNRDTQVRPGVLTADELVTLTFQDATTYVVTSDNASGTGSGGDNTGYLNQTYVDNITGFRVTLLPPDPGDYQAGDTIGYNVKSIFETGSDPTRAIPGLRMTVTDTEDIAVGDTATVRTYNKSGNEPDIGDFYYVTFDETKTGLGERQFFTTEKAALAYTGPLSQNNKLGLAAHLAFLNGAPAVALLQIEKASGSDDAPDSSYISAIDEFDEPMEGGVRPSLMQPVTTSTTVLNYLKTSNIIQAGIRYGNERISYFGFANNTSPSTAQTYARSMNSERMIGIYPDGGVTTVPNEAGQDVEILVDGSFLAAALTGRDTSPAFDVATPLTRKPVVGFNRLYRRMDTITAAQTANAGLTILEEQAAGIIVKIGLTTDLSGVLTRTPSVIRIKDFVQKGSRSILQPFIGQKFLQNKTKEIETTLGSYLLALKQAQIIADYTGVKATPDANDPTTVNVEAFYSPVLPLLWIVITFNLRSSI